MNKRKRDYRAARKLLSDHGWNTSGGDYIAFNNGSETANHLLGKLAAGIVFRDRGYRVESEVTHDDRGEIDVLGYQSPTDIRCIEIESNPDDGVVSDKYSRYVDGTPIQEMHLIDAGEVPTDLPSAVQVIENKL